MGTIAATFKKEFRSYFNSPIAYIFITVFLVLSNWLFMRGFFIYNQADMRGYFAFLPWIFLFFIPAVTMRLWAEEKKQGTLELLMTFPVKDRDVVLGKYLASLLFLTITVLLSFSIPLTISILGDPDGGPILGSYVGTILMGAAYLAIGLFLSSLTENQIIAFILGVAGCFLLFIVGEEFILSTLPQALVPLFKFLGLGTHFDSISRGVLDSRDILYYVSVVVFFLYLNVRSLESRKWK